MKYKIAFAVLFCLLCCLRAEAQTPPSEGKGAVNVMDLLVELGASLRWNPYTETGTIELNKGRAIFALDAPWVLLNYKQLLSTAGVTRRNGAVYLPGETADAIKQFFRQDALQQPRVAVILIDPGHGGKDSGAVGKYSVAGEKGTTTRTLQEKDVVLKVGKELHALLSRTYPDKRILMTRTGDEYLTLEERTELANKLEMKQNEAIIFISIHANASLNNKAKGFEVWYLPTDYRRDLIDPDSLEKENRDIAPIMNVLLEEEYSVESVTLAREILMGMAGEVGALSESRGIKEESWFVVRNARMPSVLLELGFVTHPEEARLLEQDQYLQKLINGIYTGIRNFIGAFESTSGFTE